MGGGEGGSCLDGGGWGWGVDWEGGIAACAVRGEIGDGDGAWERGSPLALPAPRRRGKEVQAEEVGGVGNM